MKKLILLIVLILVVAGGVYSYAWYNISKNIETVLAYKENEEIKTSFDHKIEGFPSTHKITLSNLIIESKDEETTQKHTVEGDVLINLNLLENKLDIITPKIYHYDSVLVEQEKGNFKTIFNDNPIIKVFYEINKTDILKIGLGLKKIDLDYVIETSKGFKIEDKGFVIEDDSGKQLFTSKENSYGVNFDKQGSNVEIDIFYDVKGFSYKELYYQWYEKLLLMQGDITPYQKKLIDYLLQFSRSAGDVSSSLKLKISGEDLPNIKEFINDGESGGGIKKESEAIGKYKIDLEKLIFTDSFGDFEINGKFLVDEENKKTPLFVEDLNIKLDNFSKISQKHIVFIVNTIHSLTATEAVKEKVGPFASSLVPDKDKLFKIIPVLNRAVADFFFRVGAIKDGNLNLNIKHDPKQKVLFINGTPTARSFLMLTTSMKPVMEELEKLKKPKQIEEQKYINKTRPAKEVNQEALEMKKYRDQMRKEYRARNGIR